MKYVMPALIVAAASAVPAHAAVITWGSATNIATGPGNSSDVSTNGTPVEAYNAFRELGATGFTSVNGVLFVNTSNLLDSSAAASDSYSATNGGDAAYDALLSTSDYGNGVSTTLVLGGGQLVDGLDYEIQVWFAEDRSLDDGRVMGFASSATDPIVQLNDQFAIGTFTADSAFQNLYLTTFGAFGNTHLTAYQIRLVPEPGSLALLGLGALCVLRRRRG